MKTAYLICIGLLAISTFATPCGAEERAALRRVVTTLDESGKAVVLFDEAQSQTAPTVATGPVAQQLWTLSQIPASMSARADLGAVKLAGGFGPEPGRVVFKSVDFPPTTAEMDKEQDVNSLMKAVGSAAPTRGRPPIHPSMHRTKTIDFAIVMAGEIDMVLDDSTVHLKAGDIVVQQETNHAWVNHGHGICRIAFVQVAAIEP